MIAGVETSVALMVIARLADRMCRFESCTWTVKAEVPEEDGVPVIAPELASRVSPFGKLPPLTDHW